MTLYRCIQAQTGSDLYVLHFQIRLPRDTTLTALRLAGVAEGLTYLHNNGMVHGDLKGVCYSIVNEVPLLNLSIQANILIDNNHNARLVLTSFRVQRASCNAQPL